MFAVKVLWSRVWCQVEVVLEVRGSLPRFSWFSDDDSGIEKTVPKILSRIATDDPQCLKIG